MATKPWLWPRAAYVHVPFCVHHCGYCDFAIAVGKDVLIDDYLDAIRLELSTLGKPQMIDTLFLGGGTPTYLSPDQLDRLLQDINHWLPLAENHEFSIEVNPDTLTTEKVEVLTRHGVNRVSLGVQSFQEPLLQTLERAHHPEHVYASVEMLRGQIPRLSIDLIFGIPGQSESDWERDLTSAIELGVEHISTYGLTYEKGTPLWKQRQRDQLLPLSEDQELQLYAQTMDYLTLHSFEQYEISSFACEGERCRHNQVYWANHAYFGFGMGAARYINGCRELNTRNLETYLDRMSIGQSPVFQSETLKDEDRARETMAIQLRRIEGIHREAYYDQTGFNLDELSGSQIAQQVGRGLIVDDGESVRLSRQGRYVADAVIERLL